MNKKTGSGILLLAAIVLALSLWFFLEPSEKVDFSADIKPILNKNCIACHGGVKKNSGLSFLFEEEAKGVAESGKHAIVPGNASASELIRRLKEDDSELRMPYQKPKLSDAEIDLLERWIDQGAEWGEHWAYSLPESVPLPKVSQEAGFNIATNGSFVKNDIDRFILARMEGQPLRPNEEAPANVLARRLALDLTGLPPEQNLFDAFTNGKITYETYADSLLAQPGFGEKWASWWLDLARYADTKGYEKDLGRSIWPYRDWAIKAFNQDMPYDQFTIEQLAGDLLPDPSVDQLIATAFHRNTMNNDEGGTDDEEFRVATVIDRTNTTFEVWQSTTIGCVQCHSHPYDPIKHEEYYNAMAFFNNSRDEDTPGEEPNVRLYGAEQQKEVDRIQRWVAEHGDANTEAAYNNFLTYMEPKYQLHTCEDFTNGELADTKWLALWNKGSARLKNVYTNNAGALYLSYWSGNYGSKITIRKDDAQGEVLSRFALDKTEGRMIKKVPFKKTAGKIDLYIEAQNEALAPETATGFMVWFAFLEDLPGAGKPGHEGIADAFLNILNSKAPEYPIVVENPDYMRRTTQVFERGNWQLKADTVHPKTPAMLNTWESSWPKNRMGLAQWIGSKKNPLTARTLVNRVWHQLFGRGLVASIEDMGTQSDPPSHPALLDWLALRLMHEHDWSMKALIKDIVMSGTYRQSSATDAETYQIDPENKFYARGPRQRLAAEQIRDQALAVSGLLSDKMYGPGVMPPQPENVWQSVYSGEQWVESKGEDRYRRAVYTYLKRTSPYPSFITFDAGSREVCTIRRTVTNTPLQALVTLNDPVYLEAAYHLAKKMQAMDTDRGIAYGYEKATFSKITPAKLEVLKHLYEASLLQFNNEARPNQAFLGFGNDTSPDLAAMTVVANAIMNLDEFLSKA